MNFLTAVRAVRARENECDFRMFIPVGVYNIILRSIWL